MLDTGHIVVWKAHAAHDARRPIRERSYAVILWHFEVAWKSYEDYAPRYKLVQYYQLFYVHTGGTGEENATDILNESSTSLILRMFLIDYSSRTDLR